MSERGNNKFSFSSHSPVQPLFTGQFMELCKCLNPGDAQKEGGLELQGGTTKAHLRPISIKMIKEATQKTSGETQQTTLKRSTGRRG